MIRTFNVKHQKFMTYLLVYEILNKNKNKNKNKLLKKK